ncbi:hypothetical protein BDV10DRAFT_201560 [Aspergillus recurvatus]
MVHITVEALEKEDTAGTSSTTFDLPAETKLADVVSLLREQGYTGPEEFIRERDDGCCGRKYKPYAEYLLRYPTQTLVVGSDCPSDYDEQSINIDDTFLHFVSLRSPSKQLSAKLEGEEKILIDGRLELSFHRTLRMPDDDKIHPLPASRGLFPLYNVEAFASRLPERITKRGGIFFPMWQREALWIKFDHRGINTLYAIRVNVGHINAVSGLDIYEASDKQDYIVVPGQEWLDGISDTVGSGYTVEGQVSGKEKFGGIQIEVIPSYERYTHAFSYSTEKGFVEYAAEHNTPRDYALKDGDKVIMAPEPSTFRGQARLCDFLDDGEGFEGIESLHLKVCPGHEPCGKLMQDIVQDTSPKGVWDKARAKILDIHILHPSDFEAVTHIVPPRTPITTEEYIEAGIPLYALEEDPDQRLDGSATLAGVKSISAMDNEIGVDGADTEFDPLKPKRIRPCNHQFCHMCVKAAASSGKNTHDEQKRCPLCAAAVSHVAGFSAPMNLPGEETFKVDVPVVMLEVQDGRVAFDSMAKMRL